MLATKRDTATLHSLLAAIFASRFGIFMAKPYLFLIFAEQGRMVEAGIVVGAMMLTVSLLGLAGGFVADRFGRVPTLVISNALAGLVCLGFAVTTDFWPLLFLAIALGVLRAAFDPPCLATLTELVPKEKQRAAMSRRYIVVNLAGALGGLSAGYLVKDYPGLSFGAVAVFSIGITIPLAILLRHLSVGRIAQEPIQFADLRRILLRDRAAQWAFFGAVTIGIAYAQSLTTIAGYLTENLAQGARHFSNLLVLNPLLVIALQVPAVKLCERLGDRGIFRLSTALLVAAFASVAFMPPLIGPYVMCVLASLAEVILFPTNTLFFANLGGDRDRATYMGLWSAAGIGAAAGPVTGAFLAETTGFGAMFGIMAGLCLVGGLFYLGAVRAQERRGPLADAEAL